MSPPGADPIGALLAQRLDLVASELAGVVGDASLCTVSRSGGSVDGAKYLEGRLAVLMELRRRLPTASVVSAELDAVGDSWRRELDRARENHAGAGWIAYRAGGVDEVEAVAEIAADVW